MLNGSCHCGALRWRLTVWPDSATLGNCTLCRRYGTLWIYGHDGEDAALTGDSRIYMTGEEGLELHFCPGCGCVAAWRARDPKPDGRRRLALNLRLAEDQDIIRPIPIRRFDGLGAFTELPGDGRVVGDLSI